MRAKAPPRSQGTLQHTREKLPWPTDRPFRILSIDGGGIRGIFPTDFLAALEERYLRGEPVGAYFDLIAGTSTGGILALGLGNRLTAAEIRELYLDKGNRIFPVDSLPMALWRRLSGLVRSAYSSAPLRAELEAVFGSSLFGDAVTRLCIPAFEGEHGEPWIYKTPHHPDYRSDQFETMLNVALATTAAPTYLKALEHNGYVLVDGGLLANTPVMVALVDALACHDLRGEQIQILSLGCGASPFHVTRARRRGGKWQWRAAVDASIGAASANALGQAYLLVGRERVTRVDVPPMNEPIGLDDSRRARDELPALARRAADDVGSEIADRFFREPADDVAMPVAACGHGPCGRDKPGNESSEDLAAPASSRRPE